jgi:hypothetical protein
MTLTLPKSRIFVAGDQHTQKKIFHALYYYFIMIILVRAKHDLTFRGARSTAALAAAQSNDRVAIEAYNHGGGARAAAACSAAGGHSPPNRAAMVTAWHPGSDDSRYARLLEYKTKF